MRLSVDSSKRTLVKVPEITAVFWVAKILTTAMGESLSDFSVNAIPAGAAVVLAFFVFLGALRWQLRQDRYRPWIYWFAVAMVAVFGTMAADGIHIGLGVPYYVSTTFYALALAAIFVAWYRTEGTLSIHSIDTQRRELFYWTCVFATFALGTAAGDMTATTFGWGYLPSGLIFGCVMAVPAILYWRTNLNRIAIFWFAYVFTRPLGASFSDYLGKGAHLHGLGLGDGNVALGFAVVIVGCVGYLARRQRPSVLMNASQPAGSGEIRVRTWDRPALSSSSPTSTGSSES
jgi:uncharacterized membrane-anchored protein